MKVTARSSLADVALAVGDALRRAGIRAVLTGGACAHLHSGGAYLSRDADFILGMQCSQGALDQALAGIGFSREGDRYVHGTSRFFVEFPRGPLGIGEDFQIRPSGSSSALLAHSCFRPPTLAEIAWLLPTTGTIAKHWRPPSQSPSEIESLSLVFAPGA